MRPGVVVALLLAGGSVLAQPEPLLIGLTTPLTGSDAAYGQGLRHGAEIAVARANAAGGVQGRPLALQVLDDAGDPARAAANARQLLDRGAVALTGVHGARSTAAVAELLAAAGQTPPAALVAPATSADLLRERLRPGVFHLRAGAAEEASAAMLYLDTLGVSRYALLSQADPLGESGRERMELELTRIATRAVANERLADSATAGDVRSVVTKVCAQRPEALILATDAVLVRIAIAAARSQPCAAHYVAFSETGAALASGPSGSPGANLLAGVMVTQVVPHPGNALHPLSAEYQRALAAHGSGPGSHPSLEGYLAIRVIQEALRACGRDAGRVCLLQVLATRSLELPGMTVQFGSAQRQPRPFVEITLLDGEGRFRR